MQTIHTSNRPAWTRRSTAAAIAVALAATLTLPAWAQGYPSKPVRTVVPFATGNATDTLARLISKKLSEQTGQPFVVDNKAGFTGHLGGEQVAKSRPDGYTLLVGVSSSLTVSPNVLKNLTYDTTEDLVPIGIVANFPSVLVVPASLPVRSVPELVAYAKAHPDTLNFASYGVGSNLHLAGELFKLRAGFKAQHVPYNAAQLASDLLAGRIAFMFENAAAALPHIKSGKLRPLALASEDAVAALPGLPTISSFYPGFSVNAWVGLFAPRATPPEVVSRLEAELQKAASSAEVARMFEEQAMVPARMDSARAAAFVRAERARWGRIVAETNVRVD